MAEIFPHPKLSTRVIYLSYPSLEVDGKAVSHGQIQDWYEQGYLIILKDFRITFDGNLFATLDTHDAKTFPKKAEARHFKLKGRIAKYPRLSRLIHPREFALRRQIHSVNGQMLAIARRLFPNYALLDEKLTWRLTEQINENMHIDTYGAAVATHQLRIFANMDLAKRIWNIGYSIDEVFQQSIGKVRRELLASGDLAKISAFVNASTFGTRVTRGPGDRPATLAMFDPGEVWIVESRQVAHQVLYGRRAVSTDFSVDKASMKFPERHYLELTRRYVEAQLKANGPAGNEFESARASFPKSPELPPEPPQSS